LKFTEEEIVDALRQVESAPLSGDLCRQFGVAAAPFDT
jgi:hypothetical protein